MNRLIIIGNGFDLAHGLPTGYCDFINSYWQDVITSLREVSSRYEDDLISIELKFIDFDYRRNSLKREFEKVDNYSSLNKFIANHSSPAPSIVLGGSSSRNERSDNCQMNYKSDFFRILNKIHSAQNWVDVENVYYEILKDCLIDGERDRKYKTNIVKINEEFEVIKKALSKYLEEKVEAAFQFSEEATKDVIEIFKSKSYEGSSLEKLFMEIPKTIEQELLQEHERFLDENRPAKGYRNRNETIHKITIQNYFLSFNYTTTIGKYVGVLGLNENNKNEIHGNLFTDLNPINFGFGDEMDKHYPLIEEKNDNEYLKNIKSFQYLHNSNYKRLLDFIDSDRFQVYIMGHSCGLSDRTLLNTIFEHENCCSIKVFYYQQKNDDGTVLSDNFTEITQNISRHFNKKKLMREKIVNKTLCEPMPQIKLPKKQNGS